jgi:eukaryotic-like serine/threonine-protein kinase
MIDESLLKVLAFVAIASISGYLINQLPSIKEFPGRNVLVTRLVVWIVLLAAALEVLTGDGAIAEQVKRLVEVGAIVAGVLLAFDLFQLTWGIFKHSKTAEPSNTTSSPTAELSRQDYRYRRVLLAKVKNSWVKGFLEKRLHQQVLITMRMEERSDAVALPWNLMLGVGNNAPQTLPPSTSPVSIFDDIGTGRSLLILGEPGSGKTITLLQLARVLIARAEQDPEQLIPVVFHLSSWSKPLNKRKSTDLPTLKDWLIEELNSKYQVPRQFGKTWVEKQQLLLLLDGLDEVQAEYRESCADAINTFQQEFGTEIIVCCRVKDYEQLGQQLQFQKAIYLKSLTPAQIQHYLSRLNLNLTGLRVLLNQDHEFRELAQSPLWLYLMVSAYEGIAADALSSGKQNRQQLLFDTYISRMMNSRALASRYSAEKTKHFLKWLARRMSQEFQTVFLIEEMQPTLLEKHYQRLLYGIGVGLIASTCLGLICWLLEMKLALWSFIPVAIINIFFISSSYVASIELFERIEWSWKKLFKAFSVQIKRTGILILGIGFLLSVALFLSREWSVISQDKMVLRLFISLIYGFAMAITLSLVLFLLFGINLGFLEGLENTRILNRSYPNQGIVQSLKNGLFVGSTSFLIGGLSFLSLLFLVTRLPPEDPTVPQGLQFFIWSWIGLVKYGLIFGLLGGLSCGLWAATQHFILRVVLFYERYIPWNYAQFLDDASDRLFLQKVGGGYIFVHRLLMEHFAQLEIND